MLHWISDNVLSYVISLVYALPPSEVCSFSLHWIGEGVKVTWLAWGLDSKQVAKLSFTQAKLSACLSNHYPDAGRTWNHDVFRLHHSVNTAATSCNF